MLRLDIPQTGEDASSTKDLVFTVLTQEHPLSLIQIHNHIKKRQNVSITYQAVRKAVDSLTQQGVLKKEDRKYTIDRDWILKLKSYFDNLFTSYSNTKSTYSFNEDFKKGDYSVYTLNSLYELDVFWGDVLTYWVDHRGDQKPISVNYGHYVWWMLINLGRETKLYEYYKEHNIDTYFIWLRDLGLNHYAADIYKKIGHKAIVTEDPGIDPYTALDICGDTIIQVKYPKEIVDKLKAFFETYKTIESASMQEITQIVHEPCEIKFIMFKNSTMAQTLIERYLAYFEP